ncbi:MAG: metallophosphoesterase [Bacteroidota bacterium]
MKFTPAGFLALLGTVFIFSFMACQRTTPEQFDTVTEFDYPTRHYEATRWPDRIIQSVSANPSEQINLSWRTSGDIITGHVEYTPSPLGPNSQTHIQPAIVKQVRYDNIHDHYFQAEVKGLQPAKEYMMRVGSDLYQSEWFPVSTAPEQFQAFRFLYFGDIQSNVKGLTTRIYRHALLHYSDAKFMVHTGDIINGSNGNHDDDQWGDWFYACGWMLQKIPVLAAAGNGDHIPRKDFAINAHMLSPQWNGVFNLPANGPEELSNLAYYFDYPGIRIVSLYSWFESLENNGQEIFLNNDLAFTRDHFNQQLRWLERALSSNTQPWLAVVVHHPVFAARKKRHNTFMQQQILPLLEKYKVDLVMQGNDHVYARGNIPDQENNARLPVFVTSVAGGDFQEVDHTHQWIKKYRENAQIYQVIHVNRNTLKLEAIDSRGRLVDRYWIRRGEDNTKTMVE